MGSEPEKDRRGEGPHLGRQRDMRKHERALIIMEHLEDP